MASVPLADNTPTPTTNVDSSTPKGKHRWADSKVYTRKSFNRNNSKPTPTLANPNKTTTVITTTTDDVISSIQNPAPPPAASDDSSSNPPRSIKLNLATCTRTEARNLRRKLSAELETVHSLLSKIESQIPKKLPLVTTNSEAASVTPIPIPAPVMPARRQLTVSVLETNNSNEKEKRTPKANQFYQNSDFVLGKDKFPPSELKKPQETKFIAQAFKNCHTLLSKLMKHKHGWVFNTPVDVKGLGLHDYYTIIKNPMDLGTVKSRLSKNWYKTPKEFAEDVRLTFRNAMTYNPKGQDVHFMAEQLLQMFEERWPAIEAEYSYVPPVVKRPPPPPPVEIKRMLERSDSTAVESKTMTPKVYTPQIGRPPALKKPKAKDPHKRDMTFEEKQRLSNNLQNLPTEKLDNIVQIIKKRNSSLSQHDDEIEVDIDSVDTETLWELDRFVTNYKKSLSKNKRRAELAVLAGQYHEAHLGGHERTSHSVVAEKVPKESKSVVEEKDVTSSSPVGGEKKGGNPSRSSSSSSSSSGSGSSSSDSDSDSSSANGSDAAHSP